VANDFKSQTSQKNLASLLCIQNFYAFMVSSVSLLDFHSDVKDLYDQFG
jgi:hypothetical protein